MDKIWDKKKNSFKVGGKKTIKTTTKTKTTDKVV